MSKVSSIRWAARSAKRAVKGSWYYLRYLREFREFSRQSGNSERFPVKWSERMPLLYDRTATTAFDRHYIYHPAWAARIIAQTRPELHIDISSTLHFVSILSAFVPVDFYDYRPADLVLSNLGCKRADLMALPFHDNSVRSISCMHVVEHIGLGRYGDPLDPDGDLKAMKELARVVAPGGDLLFVTPVGKPVLKFNDLLETADRFGFCVVAVAGVLPDSGIFRCAGVERE
jgi:SAM-dependent methyltransferase